MAGTVGIQSVVVEESVVSPLLLPVRLARPGAVGGTSPAGMGTAGGGGGGGGRGEGTADRATREEPTLQLGVTVAPTVPVMGALLGEVPVGAEELTEIVI